MIAVKGDGSLMNESIARKGRLRRSYRARRQHHGGATFLENIDDGLVVDVGGTTTDIAVLKHGMPRPMWKGRGSAVGCNPAAAAEVNTFGPWR